MGVNSPWDETGRHPFWGLESGFGASSGVQP